MIEAKFYTPLKVSLYDENRDVWKIEEELVYQCGFLNTVIRVPKGFLTDFASVPRLPFAYWLTGNTARQAAVVHDFLYQTHDINGFHATKRKCDLVFLEAMKASDIVRWRREIMYGAVFVGGWISYWTGRDRFKVLGNS